jgi:diguanylate cyclase (GGDEF)-like protein
MYAQQRLKKTQTEILLIFAAIIFFETIFLVTVILESSNATIRERVSSLTATNSKQLELNINSYLDKVETTAALLFADESYYEYDATDDSLDSYDKLKIEESIFDRIVDLGLMENFADLGIVYANNHTVGWISHSTEGMFSGDEMYDTFADCITNETTNDGWIFGLNGNIDRMFYVKRLNPNAVLISSFYNRELDSVFKYTQELQDMTIRLADDNDNILFSTQTDEIGSRLPDEISSRLPDETTVTVMDREYLINANICQNGWRVICSIQTSLLLKSNIRLRYIAILFSAALCIAFIAIGLLMIRRITRPIDGVVSNLATKAEFDQLSGLLNKISFEDKVNKSMEYHDMNRRFVFIMLDADNFKQVNDCLGHACGDQVIVRISHLLLNCFDAGTWIGRLGGDEFGICIEYFLDTREMVCQHVERFMKMLFFAFSEEFGKEHSKCELTLSAGVCIADDEIRLNFQTLYRRADAALYVSKRSGKNRYTMYQEGMEYEETI